MYLKIGDPEKVNVPSASFLCIPEKGTLTQGIGMQIMRNYTSLSLSLSRASSFSLSLSLSPSLSSYIYICICIESISAFASPRLFLLAPPPLCAQKLAVRRLESAGALSLSALQKPQLWVEKRNVPSCPTWNPPEGPSFSGELFLRDPSLRFHVSGREGTQTGTLANGNSGEQKKQ